jgi:hypothetical protein
MPRCVVCRTTEGVELYKGRYFCPDHRGSPEEMLDKVSPPTVLEALGLPAELTGIPPSSNRAMQSFEATHEYVRGLKQKEESRVFASFRVPTQSDMMRKELRLRYG